MSTIVRLVVCTVLGALVGVFYLGEVALSAFFGLVIGVTWPLLMGGPDRERLLNLLQIFDERR